MSLEILDVDDYGLKLNRYIAANRAPPCAQIENDQIIYLPARTGRTRRRAWDGGLGPDRCGDAGGSFLLVPHSQQLYLLVAVGRD